MCDERIAELELRLAEAEARSSILHKVLDKCGTHIAECSICEPPHEGCDCGLDRVLAMSKDANHAALDVLLAQAKADMLEDVLAIGWPDGLETLLLTASLGLSPGPPSEKVADELVKATDAILALKKTV